MEFERLVAEHKDAVYRQMVRVCGNYDDAEDTLAEALMAAYRHMEKLRDPEAFRAWLATIGRRVCGKLKRSEALRPILELGDEMPGSESPHEAIEMGELKRCVQSAIERLPANLREVYLRREIEGRPAWDVAKELGISEANVKTRLHRAREKVRTYLDGSVCG